MSQLGIDVVLVQPSNYPTNIFASAQLPEDTARAGSYGEIGTIPAKMVKTLLDLFQGENAPNPHDVAEAIAQIVAQPHGSRAPRTVVGQSFGTDVINTQAAAVQEQLIEGLGLGRLAAPRNR